MERKICTERSQQGLPTSLILLRFDHTTMVMIVLVVADGMGKSESPKVPLNFQFCILYLMKYALKYRF